MLYTNTEKYTLGASYSWVYLTEHKTGILSISQVNGGEIWLTQ